MSLPPYVIEPPDVLLIKTARIVPRGTYLLQTGDGLAVDIEGWPQIRLDIDPSGRIDFAKYGKVTVGGLSLADATEAIRKQLQEARIGGLEDPQVAVHLDHAVDLPAIDGEFLVWPDGTVNLGGTDRSKWAA